MPKAKETLYTAWEFTQEESYNAFIFQDLQFKHIQTELAILAQNAAALSFNPDLPNADDRFIREREYIRGGMDALGALLSTHENTRDELIEIMKQKQEFGLANQQKGTES